MTYNNIFYFETFIYYFHYERLICSYDSRTEISNNVNNIFFNIVWPIKVTDFNIFEYCVP
jgi:hypothetical protein